MSHFSHIDNNNMPCMVDVSQKSETLRFAHARTTIWLPEIICSKFIDGDIQSKKGPVFQTSIIAGIQGVKKTSELIPMCHPLLINGVDIDINIIDSKNIEVFCEVAITGKTGVEMEALTGANITCLTIYDMCKSISQEMVIKEVKLLVKTGGKSDIKN